MKDHLFFWGIALCCGTIWWVILRLLLPLWAVALILLPAIAIWAWNWHRLRSEP